MPRKKGGGEMEFIYLNKQFYFVWHIILQMQMARQWKGNRDGTWE
jgi:hypothetical protein